MSPATGTGCIARRVVQCVAVQVLQAGEALSTATVFADVALGCRTPILVSSLVAMRGIHCLRSLQRLVLWESIAHYSPGEWEERLKSHLNAPLESRIAGGTSVVRVYLCLPG